jgi:predicted esterase
VVNGEHLSPYTIKTVGDLSVESKKWPLVIAMHGGGNAPPEVNDSQWAVMQRYYKDQPDLGGYKYLALRAPNNSWNGFYDNYVYPLIENLIAQQIAFGKVDRNRIYIMGYSHGGYGAFAIGPKMPHRFAAIHASASAPTDGETTPKTLRSTRFTYMIGENDTAYGRRERCEAFAKKVAELRGERQDVYPVEMFFKPGFGHGGLPDRDMIRAMLPFRRNPVPREVTWEMTDPIVDDFFWLSVATPAKGQSVDARILPGSNNVPQIELETEHIEQLTIWLDERLIGTAKEVDINLNGQIERHQLEPSIKNLCDSLLRRADPDLSFKCRIDLKVPKQE